MAQTDKPAKNRGTRSYGTGGQSEPESNIGQHIMPPDAEDIDEGEEMISDLPQDITESYGTGVKPEPGYNIGTRRLEDEMSQYTSTSPDLTGGDIDAAWEQADMVGDEAVGGTVSTPDQDIVDDLGKAVGTEMRDREDFYGYDKFEVRDDRRWELDPQSSDDYGERRE
jgi:Family of unknown function (DUF6335)